MEAAPDGFAVVPAVGANRSQQAVRWAEQAAELGAPAIMALPPNSYRGDERAVFEHYRALASVGLPVVAYNNPIDTKVDLTPRLLAQLHADGLIVAVKEFAGDPRRAYEMRELAPELDVLIGSDDTVLEVALAGAKGWVSGYTSAFPCSCVALYRASVAADIETALPLYRALHPLLRWDSRTEFVQAIKLSMDMVGRHGGACRPPRVALERRARGRDPAADRAGGQRRPDLAGLPSRPSATGLAAAPSYFSSQHLPAARSYFSSRPTQRPRMCLMCELDQALGARRVACPDRRQQLVVLLRRGHQLAGHGQREVEAEQARLAPQPVNELGQAAVTQLRQKLDVEATV